jgi:hypothetical protein
MYEVLNIVWKQSRGIIRGGIVSKQVSPIGGDLEGAYGNFLNTVNLNKTSRKRNNNAPNTNG